MTAPALPPGYSVPTEDGAVCVSPAKHRQALLLSVHGPRGGYLGHVTLRTGVSLSLIGALERAEKEAAEALEDLERDLFPEGEVLPDQQTGRTR